MKIYYYIPYLLRLEKRRGLFKNVNLYDIDPELKKRAGEFLLTVRLSRMIRPIDPLTYFLALFTVASSTDATLRKRFIEYSIKLAAQVKDVGKLLEKYYGKKEYSLRDFLKTSVRRGYTVHLAYLNISNGVIKQNLFLLLNELAWDIDTYMADLTQKLEPQIRDQLAEIYNLSIPRRPGKKNIFYERILAASGIEDGKKRIIYHWLAPYLVTIKGLTKEEAINVLQEWLSRQAGNRVPVYWIRAEVESVIRKRLVPWKKEKVLERDKQLEEILRKHQLI